MILRLHSVILASGGWFAVWYVMASAGAFVPAGYDEWLVKIRDGQRDHGTGTGCGAWRLEAGSKRSVSRMGAWTSLYNGDGHYCGRMRWKCCPLLPLPQPIQRSFVVRIGHDLNTHGATRRGQCNGTCFWCEGIRIRVKCKAVEFRFRGLIIGAI